MAETGVESIEVSSETPLLVFNLKILQCEEEDGQWGAEDDVRGGSLPVNLVKAARQKEIKYLKDRKVYSHDTVIEAWRQTRKKPFKLKWIERTKETEKHSMYGPAWSALKSEGRVLS